MRVFLAGSKRSALRRFVLPLALVCSVVSTLGAQVTESPVPFDSAGQVRSITPALASRLGLTAPAWPVSGEYEEARLFSVSTGGYVVSVQRRGGRVDRYVIDETQRATLRSQITEAMVRVGRVVGEEGPAVVSEAAGRPFIRNQMILSALLYGPAAATLTHDARAGAGVYLLTTGASFFYLANLAKHVTVTRAQNHLATDGAVRGALIVGGALNAVGVDPNEDWGAASTLIGGIGGSMVGYAWGKRLTDSEAHSATVGSTLLAGTVAGTVGSLGGFDNDDDGRAASAALVGGALVGYPLGLRYPRHASYSVTAGDAKLLPLGAILALGVVGTPLVDTDVDEHAIGGLLTGGFVVGTLLADRALVRPYDHTESDATLVWLGALAGGLIGGAVPLLSDSDDGHFILGSITAGSILGTVAAVHLVEPRRARPRASRGASIEPPGRERRAGRFDVRFTPANLALAASGRPGRYSLLSIGF